MDFPRLVYKSPTVYLLVEEANQFDAALGAGWFASVPEAVRGVADTPVDTAPPTREELEQKATELGLKFDGRTSDRKLRDMIAAALED